MAVIASCAKIPALPPASMPSPLAYQAVPDFNRATVAGLDLDTGRLRGQVLVVKFFASYCEPCRRTLRATEVMHRKHPQVAFVGISEDHSMNEARILVDEFDLSFPVIHDRGNTLASRFRVTEMPIVFVIDGRGVVRWVGGPIHDRDDIEAAIVAIGTP